MDIKVTKLAQADVQRAIDLVSLSGGGRVILPPGKCYLEDAIHMRDGVHLEGVAGETVLVKNPSFAVRLKGFLGYGHYEILVAEPERFHPGMGVYIYDEHAHGFYTTVATVTGVDGERVFIDHMLNHDYHERDGGTVVTVHSLLSFRGVHKASAANLVLDGNREHVAHELNGCRGGGVFMLTAHQITIENIEVRNFNGDGISFQQCTDVRVLHCHVHHNVGHGLHPGSGSVRYWLLENQLTHNGRDGIYYCLRTTHSLCADNLIAHNGRVGVSLGTRDTNHLLLRNKIEGNGGCGVRFRDGPYPANYVELRENELSGNCVAQDEAEIIIGAGLAHVQLVGNHIAPRTGVKPLVVDVDTHDIHLPDNHPPIPSAQPGVSHVKVTLPVGPSAADAYAARHLNVVLT